MLGIELDGWQRLVLDVGLELVDGVPAFHDVVVTTPRQQGKSVVVFVIAVYALLSLQDELILYGAQQRQDARTRLVEEWWPQLQRSELAGQFELSRGAGFECLTATRTGSRLRLLSTTEQTSGHGSSPTLVLLDETWAMREHVSEAIRPATIAKPGSQIWAISTAGTSASTWWRSQVDVGASRPLPVIRRRVSSSGQHPRVPTSLTRRRGRGVCRRWGRGSRCRWSRASCGGCPKTSSAVAS